MNAMPPGVLYDATMIERAAAAPLLQWLYDSLPAGETSIAFTLTDAAAQLGAGLTYITTRRMWALLKDAPCFVSVERRNRGGVIVTFDPAWLADGWTADDEERAQKRAQHMSEFDDSTPVDDEEGAQKGAQHMSEFDGSTPADDEERAQKRAQKGAQHMSDKAIRAHMMSAFPARSHESLHDHDHGEIRESRDSRFSSASSPAAPAAALLAFPTRASGPQRATPSGDPNQQCAGVRVLVELLGTKKRPNALQAAEIAELVPEGDAAALARWRQLVKQRVRAGKTRIDWMLDEMKAGARPAAQRPPRAAQGYAPATYATPDPYAGLSAEQIDAIERELADIAEEEQRHAAAC